MIYPSADKLENWGSKYSLVVLAAKRAKQIKSGAPPLIDTASRNPLTIALEEIAAGKIQCQVADHDILPKTTQEAEVAQLLAIPTLSIDEEEAGEETATVLTDDTELITEDEEELEEEEEAVIEEDNLPISGLEDEEEEEEHAHVDDEVDADLGIDIDSDDEEAEVDTAAADEAELLAPPEEPKPKRGRKKKVDVEPEPAATEDSDD